MSLDYSIDSEAGVIYVVSRGEVVVEEYRGLLDAIASDADHDSAFAWIYDLSGTRPPDAESLRRVAAIDRRRQELFEHARQVAVAPDELMYGMARMFEILSDELPGSRHVCRSLEEAKEWLGLPDDWEPPEP